MIEEHERTNASLYDLSKLYDLQSDWLDLNKRDYSSKGQGKGDLVTTLCRYTW